MITAYCQLVGVTPKYAEFYLICNPSITPGEPREPEYKYVRQ